MAIVTSGQPSRPEGPIVGYAYRVLDKENVILEGGNPFDPIEGDQTKAVLPAIIEVVLTIPDGSELDVILKEKYLRDELNRLPENRIANGYMKANGKELLEDELALRSLDEVLLRRKIRINSRLPTNVIEQRLMKQLKALARSYCQMDPRELVGGEL